MIVTCAVFLGCASCSYGPASLFFFAPYFARIDSFSNDSSSSLINTSSFSSLLYCAATDGHRRDNSTNMPSADDGSSKYSLRYLECAFMWSNISTGLLHLVGALIVGFGGVSVFSYSGNDNVANSNNNDDNKNNNTSSNEEETRSTRFSESGVGAPDEITGKLPGQRYFKIFYVSVFAASFFGLLSGILSLPAVSGRDGDAKKSSSSSSNELLLWTAVGCALVGSCFIGAAVLSLMSGVSVRWPNLYDVLFEGAARGIHSIKPRKVNRVKEREEFIMFPDGAPGAGGKITSRMGSSFETNEEDTLDYLHLAITTPPTILFACYIAGWAVSFFFANVALLSIADESQTRSAIYAFVLLCACPMVSFLLGKLADCCSVDEFEGPANHADDALSMGSHHRVQAASQHHHRNDYSSSSNNNNDNRNTTTTTSVHTLASLGGRSVASAVHSVGADGLGWANNDFSPDFFRSTIMTLVYSLGEVVASDSPDSRCRFDAASEQLPRRLALRVVRSLRIMGTYLTFVLLPLLLSAVVGAQVRVTGFSITIKPAIANHIYGRLNILTSQVPMMIVWWLVLWLLTKAVFLRSGLLKYICIGFSLCIKASFVLVPLMVVHNKELAVAGSTAPDPNASKEVLPQVAAFFPPFVAAAAQTQLNVFSLALAFCVLPRPMMPIAIAVLSACWGVGELSAIRVSPHAYDINDNGFPVIVTLFLLTIIILLLFLLIVRWKNGFANPRALLTRFKQEAMEDAERQQRLEAAVLGAREQQEYNNNNNNNNNSNNNGRNNIRSNNNRHGALYGSVDVGGGAYSAVSSGNTSRSNDDNNDQQPPAAAIASAPLIIPNATTRGSYGSYDVLPPHRLLHWSPSEIDAAFTVFDSTESTYIGGGAVAAAGEGGGGFSSYQVVNANNYAGGSNSSVAAQVSTLGQLPPLTPNSHQQQQRSNSSNLGGVLPPPLMDNNGMPRKMKKNSTPRADSDLKYYAVRKNSGRS